MCLGKNAGYDVTVANSGEAGVAAAKRSPPDAALVDMRLGGIDGLATARALSADVPAVAIVLMTAYATIDNAVDAMRAGAADYLPKPFTPGQVLHVLTKVLDTVRLRRELSELKRVGGRGIHPRLDTKSAAMQQALAVVSRAAPTDATVLLLGETGTGKGVMARHIHAQSLRRDRLAVTFNCAVVSKSLIENELFGHSKGAFTGANAPRVGHIEAAGNGTIFLDDVGELPARCTGKALASSRGARVRADRGHRTAQRRTLASLRRQGSRSCKAALTSGEFREDLYYRLNVVTARDFPPFEIATRRHRRPSRASILEQTCAHSTIAAPPDTRAERRSQLWRAYAWPGNVRELINVLERAAILAEGASVTPDLFPEEVRVSVTAVNASDDDSLEAAERRHIAAVIAKTPTLDTAAKALGIDPSTLFRKRERYGLR